jgi:hypothetical protein
MMRAALNPQLKPTSFPRRRESMLSLLRHVVDESRSRIEGGGASIVTFLFFSMGSRLRGNDGFWAVGEKKPCWSARLFC